MLCLDKVYNEGLRLEPDLIAQYKRKDATAITKHLLSCINKIQMVFASILNWSPNTTLQHWTASFIENLFAKARELLRKSALYLPRPRLHPVAGPSAHPMLLKFNNPAFIVL